MSDCRVSPRPKKGIEIISAGGINDGSQMRPHTERLQATNAAPC